MKKIYSAVLVLFCAAGLQAQVLNVATPNMTINIPANSSAYAMTDITNVTNNTVLFEYVVLGQNLDPAWDMQFCDPLSCFMNVHSTDTFSLGREASGIFKLEIDANGVGNTATFSLKVYPVSDPSDVDTITWSINTTLVGVADEAFGKEIALYPSPANADLFLASSQGSLLKGEVSIFDLNGKLMSSTAVKPVSEMRLDVAGLAPGMYLLRYSTANGVVNRKFMKGE